MYPLPVIPTIIVGLAGSIIQIHHPVYVPKTIVQEALVVHYCEGDPWNDLGPYYLGGLGWRPATWLSFKARWMPRTMNLATPKEQIWAFWQFTKYYHFIPDRNGCHGY